MGAVPDASSISATASRSDGDTVCCCCSCGVATGAAEVKARATHLWQRCRRAATALLALHGKFVSSLPHLTSIKLLRLAWMPHRARMEILDELASSSLGDRVCGCTVSIDLQNCNRFDGPDGSNCRTCGVNGVMSECQRHGECIHCKPTRIRLCLNSNRFIIIYAHCTLPCALHGFQ